MTRPTFREIDAKLSTAKAYVARGAVRFVNAKAMRGDLLDLDFLIEDAVELLPQVLDELHPKLYRGLQPPQKSYEDLIKGCELYAFSWESGAFGCAMYFKFAIKGDALWVVSLHKDRPTTGEGNP